MQMQSNTLVSGARAKCMALAQRPGQREHATQATILRVLSRALGPTIGQMAQSMLASGARMRLMVTEVSSGKTGAAIQASGAKETCMVMDATFCQMASVTKGSTRTIRSTVLASTSGPTVVYTKASGSMVSNTDWPNTRPSQKTRMETPVVKAANYIVATDSGRTAREPGG